MKNKTKIPKNVPKKKQLKKLTIDSKTQKNAPKQEEEWKKIQWLLCLNSNHFPNIRFIFKQFQLFLFITCCNSYYSIFPIRLYTKSIEKANKIHYCSYLKSHTLEISKRYCATCDKWICQKCEQRHFKLCRKAFNSNIELPDKGIEKLEKEKDDNITRKVNSLIQECQEIIEYHNNIKDAIVNALKKKENSETLIKKINYTYNKHNKINQDILAILYLLLVNYKNYPISSKNIIYTFARIKVEEVLFSNIIDEGRIEQIANDYIKYISSYFIIKNQVVHLNEGTIDSVLSDDYSCLANNSSLIIAKKDIINSVFTANKGKKNVFVTFDSNRIFFSESYFLYLLNLNSINEPRQLYKFNQSIISMNKHNISCLLIQIENNVIAIFDINLNQIVSFIKTSISIKAMLSLSNGNILLSGFEGKVEIFEREQNNNYFVLIDGTTFNIITKHPMPCFFYKIIECQRGNAIVAINQCLFEKCLCFIETTNFNIIKSEDASNDEMDVALLSNSTIIVNEDGYISLYDEYSFDLIYAYDGRPEDEELIVKKNNYYVYDEYNSALLDNMLILDKRTKYDNVIINEGIYYLDINY